MKQSQKTQSKQSNHFAGKSDFGCGEEEKGLNHQSRCYKTEAQLTFRRAVEKCHQNQKRLISLYEADAYEQILKIIPELYPGKTKVSFWLLGTSNRWTWSDGDGYRDVTGSRWGTDVTMDKVPFKDSCLVITQGGLWKNLDCVENRKYICEQPLSETTSTAPAMTSSGYTTDMVSSTDPVPDPPTTGPTGTHGLPGALPKTTSTAQLSTQAMQTTQTVKFSSSERDTDLPVITDSITHRLSHSPQANPGTTVTNSVRTSHTSPAMTSSGSSTDTPRSTALKSDPSGYSTDIVSSTDPVPDPQTTGPTGTHGLPGDGQMAPQIGPIVGAVIGSVCAIVLIMVSVLLFLRCNCGQRKPSELKENVTVQNTYHPDSVAFNLRNVAEMSPDHADPNQYPDTDFEMTENDIYETSGPQTGVTITKSEVYNKIQRPRAEPLNNGGDSTPTTSFTEECMIENDIYESAEAMGYNEVSGKNTDRGSLNNTQPETVKVMKPYLQFGEHGGGVSCAHAPTSKTRDVHFRSVSGQLGSLPCKEEESEKNHSDQHAKKTDTTGPMGDIYALPLKKNNQMSEGIYCQQVPIVVPCSSTEDVERKMQNKHKTTNMTVASDAADKSDYYNVVVTDHQGEQANQRPLSDYGHVEYMVDNELYS